MPTDPKRGGRQFLLKVCGITKIYPNLTVFRNINFSTERGNFGVFLGPSGCGKSTLFRVIAGIEGRDSGHIEWKGVKGRSRYNAAKGPAFALVHPFG